MLPKCVQIRLPNVDEDEILAMADSQLPQAELIGEVGDAVHLVGRQVSGDLAGRLQRQVDDGIARDLVLDDVAPHPRVE